ncbi:MAG: glutamate 5-kinase [Alphaproteobacteria bacterium]|nr:glutamate 5-kinase [Alphaproteobacteria bacterium]
MRTQSIPQDIIDRAKRSDSRVTLKLGTSSLIDTNKWAFRDDWFSSFIDNTFSLSLTFAIVSSGAIGLERAERGGYQPADLGKKQALAAIGQPKLIAKYTEAFKKHGISAGQILGSKINFTDPEGRANARRALDSLRKLNAVPVINENDSVYTDEIRYGDNDRLAAYTAIADGATTLILITDIDGVYTDNPKKNPNAQKIDIIDVLDAKVMALGQGSGGDHACGGMATKLMAAFIAAKHDAPHGIDTVILDGRDPECVKKLFEGDFSHATFIPHTAHSQMSLGF